MAKTVLPGRSEGDGFRRGQMWSGTAMVEQEVLLKCQSLLGYSFRNAELLSLALTHSSVAPTRVQSNERLEFLGDAILGVVVCQELYENDQEMLEGDMTKIKSAVVSRQTCAAMAWAIGVCDLLHLGKGLALRRAMPQSMAAAVFEAIVGAIYLDGGLEPARAFILKYVRPHIDEALENEHQRNYKSLLQQHAQRTWNSTPEYLVLDEKGPEHSKCFEVVVSINGRHFPSAWGMSKKLAEQEAARRALTELGLLKDSPEQTAP